MYSMTEGGEDTSGTVTPRTMPVDIASLNRGRGNLCFERDIMADPW